MKTRLHWKRKAFSSTSEIFSEATLIGRLRENSWNQSAEGELNGENYHFKTKGIFKPVTQITQSESNSPIGKIEYNSWKTKASIQLSGKTIQWRYDNIWNTRWSLSDSAGILMKFKGNASKGNIAVEKEDDLLLLTGLFVTNYYRQMAIILLVAIMIPIFASVTG